MARDITSAGGSAEVAVLDALDARAVDEHAEAVIAEAGGIDVTFNLIGRGDVQGIPLVQMTEDDLLRAVDHGLRSNFITARAAARYMIERRSGVILHLNSASGGGAKRRETIELAFLAALQVLPPRQRAVLIARDVLGWSAAQTASLLDTSVAAANSALQRARTTMQQHLPARRSEWPARQPSAAERALLEQFIDAHERGDAAAAVAIAARGIRVTMPPHPFFFEGLAAIAPLLGNAFGPDREGDWRLVPTRANRMPTAASYLRRWGTRSSERSSSTCCRSKTA